VVVMQLTRQFVVDILRKTGYKKAADKALLELPDPVDSDQVAAWGVKYGVTMDQLISEMGGSP
jgi:hypothetical protein